MKAINVNRVVAGLMALSMTWANVPFNGIRPFSEYAFTVNAADLTGSCGDNANFVFDSETGTLTISGTGAIKDYGSRNVEPHTPWGVDDVKRVIIKEGITSIGGAAFHGCYDLESVILPSSLASIGEYAFGMCDSLTTITIPEGVSSIGYGAFADCISLNDVVLPQSVGSLEANSFFGCKKLDSITINNSKCNIADDKNTITEVATIYGSTNSTAQAYASKYNRKFVATDDSTVQQCGENLTWAYNSAKETLYISGSGQMTNWSTNTLDDIPWYNYCSEIKHIVINRGATSIGECAFYNCTSLEDVSIPEGVKAIEANAFISCKELKSVSLPDSLTSIGAMAFASTGLTSFTIPQNLENLGRSVYSGCYFLQSVNVSNGNKHFSSENGLLFDKNKNTLLYYPRIAEDECVIPDGVTCIGESAFSGCGFLKKIILPDSLTTIKHSAFSYCSGISEIVIPENVVTIEGQAFDGCIKLTSITIPKNVESIVYSTFNSCSSLESIRFENPECIIYDNSKTIPDAVTLYGYSESSAEKYAQKYNRTFVSIGTYQGNEPKKNVEKMLYGIMIKKRIYLQFQGLEK